jgi:protein O-GlcNAc transferase
MSELKSKVAETGVTRSEAFKQAIAAAEGGDFARAEQLCVAVLAATTNFFEARYLLAIAQARLGCHAAALANYEKALALRPDEAEVFFDRGNTLRSLDRHEDALASYDHALAMAPDHAGAWCGGGAALVTMCRFADALRYFDKALAIEPENVAALQLRGALLIRVDRFAEAFACFDRVLAIQPDHAETLNSRGNALAELQRFEEALSDYQNALAVRPDFAEAHNNRGNALQALSRFDEALESYNLALALRPDYAEALINRSASLRELGRFEEAVASHEKALAAKPELLEARVALCMAQLPILYLDEREISLRRAAYEQQLLALCDTDRPWCSPADPKGIRLAQPFYLGYQGRDDHDLQACYGAFACATMAKCYPPTKVAAPPAAGERVRVGIVSGFFRLHSNWKVRIKGWLGQLDRSRFRVFGYYTGALRDAETNAAIAMCDRFVQGPLSIERWCTEISADAPHVLIYPEVGMDHVAATLAAQRLAAVQCNSWSHPVTSGLPTLDYFLSSDLMEPPNGQDHYTERLVRLPNLSVYYEPVVPTKAPAAQRNFGLGSTGTIYWCGQSLYKYLPQFDEVFPRIGRGAGDCKFVFIEYQNGKPITDLFRRRLDRAFHAFGLNAEEHCVFLPRLDQDAFIAAIGECDVVLDNIGWSGCNSTLESLAHDLPIVTLAGSLMRGRHSMAILEMMGVTETVAGTIDDFVTTAVRLARDVAWRNTIKLKVAANKHRIYRDPICISALERFLDRVARPPPPTR